jgi:hypothetical protein
MIQGGNPFLTKRRAKEQDNEVNEMEGEIKYCRRCLSSIDSMKKLLSPFLSFLF